MPIQQSKRPIAAARMAAIARDLLNASPLCAIATAQTRHSRNIRTNATVAIAVYDSNQSWGKPDRGIQLFGSARELEGAAIRDSETLYEERFPDYRQADLSAPYRFYRFRPRGLKLFDERTLGTGVFVTAKVAGRGRLTWERTEVYRSG